MGFLYFDNYIDANVGVTADAYYRDLTQAFINQQWDNTSAKTPENGGALLEQSAIGSSVYSEIEAWLAPIVADTSTGLKYPEDFLKVIFKDIDHSVQRGLMYQYNNEYWIAYSYASFDGLPQSVGVRRCNNVLKIVDPNNGAIFQIPCCVDYDMLAPTPQVSRYIITPNSHAVVMVQGNDDTNRLFKINSRFILGGRPFKLYAFQNTIKYNSSDSGTSLLYLDLYLDEEHADDDIANQVAYNGTYDYSVVILNSFAGMRALDNGTLYGKVLFNGKEIDRDIVWSTNNEEYINIVHNSTYRIKKDIPLAPIVRIIATLDNNENIQSSVRVTGSSASKVATVYTSPIFNTMRQYEEVRFSVYAYYNGVMYDTFDSLNVTLSNDNAILTQISTNEYSLKAVNVGSFNIIIDLETRAFVSAHKVIPIDIESMM